MDPALKAVPTLVVGSCCTTQRTVSEASINRGKVSGRPPFAEITFVRRASGIYGADIQGSSVGLRGLKSRSCQSLPLEQPSRTPPRSSFASHCRGYKTEWYHSCPSYDDRTVTEAGEASAIWKSLFYSWVMGDKVDQHG